ncbi:LysM peptidoglycan-binding domain-containing M23 family metallopeptidase [bacterium]|nr:LysM peptidoglycan-binding domain-containing M23 family metallopeptidase [bacterium]
MAMRTHKPRFPAAVLAAAWFIGWFCACPPVHAASSQLRTLDRYHVVAPGENLYRIALAYGVDLKDLCELNGITDPGSIEKGQRLRIPRKKQTRVGIYHVVEEGETLSAIAAAYHFTERSLASVNRIRTNTPLRRGQLIWIPGAGERQAVAQSPASRPTTVARSPSQSADFQPAERPGSRRAVKAAEEAAEEWRGSRPAVPLRNLAGPPATTAAPAPRVAQKTGHYHVVARGENLRRIGEKYGIYNWHWLAQVNHLVDPNALELGQRIYIPSLAERPALAALEPSAPDAVTGASVDLLASAPFKLEREPLDGLDGGLSTRVADLVPPLPDNGDGTVDPAPPIPLEDAPAPPSIPVRMTAVPLDFAWPLPVRAVRTVPFGVQRGKTFHRGVDLAAAENTPILAVADGVVEVVGSEGDSWGKFFGNYVFIKHGEYKNKTCRTIYMHASKILVKAGQPVKKGQVIARVGNTGRTHGPDGGYHLHLELWYGDDCVDPWPVLEPKRPPRDENMASAE